MSKPEWREGDPNPSRSDDITLVFPWIGGSYTGSGRYFAIILVSLGLFLVSVASLAFNVWHDMKAERRQAFIERTAETMVCVMSLNEIEKRAFRLEGRYCDGYQQRRR